MAIVRVDRIHVLTSVVTALLALSIAGCKSMQGQVPEFTGTAAASGAEAKSETAVFAGGCFWGVDAVFRHVRGVEKVVSGYSGGKAKTAEYEIVSTGDTGHAESVKIAYDPAQVSFAQLLRVFFSVATDPTQVNRQGADVGTQYRSVIFYTSAEQHKTALAYIAQLNNSHTFPQPIATQVVPLTQFYAAEDYHQNYLAQNLDNPYIIFNDLPKLRALKKEFPVLYKP